MPSGTYRRVFLVGKVAIKLPRPRNLIAGMRCNRWEREMWSHWRPIFGWDNLCPVVFADPFGLIVLMPRAKQPVSFVAVVEATPDYYPNITSETKPEDFGLVEGKVVALDYGLPDRDLVAQRRAYYQEKKQ